MAQTQNNKDQVLMEEAEERQLDGSSHRESQKELEDQLSP